MMSGVTNCTTLTPRFPIPTLIPFAVPFLALGKNGLMFAVEEDKQPPPSPHKAASKASTENGVSGF
ncbi:hypothetical protein D3C73_1453320 [compost metagenome]